MAPSYQKIEEEWFVDQTLRTRNFNSNPRVKESKQAYWSRVRQKTSARKEKWENAFNGRRTDSVQEDIYCSSHHGSHSGQRAQSSSSKEPTQTDGSKLHKYGNLRGEGL